jgi:hypothetical protein
MVNRELFIEGANAPKNVEAAFREAFKKLLSQKISVRPRINMGGGKGPTIRQFLNCKSQLSILLVDLDGHVSTRESDLTKNNLQGRKDLVHYMIYEMEGWILSQPEILDEYYNAKISDRVTKKHGGEFPEPDKELERLTKDTKKGPYHKVRHGIDLVEKLNAEKLAKDFPDDFGRLIHILSK